MTSTPGNRDEDDSPVLRVLQSKAETRAFYNKISAFYDLLSERSEEPIRQEGLEVLNARPGEKVLEIGIGTGHCLVALARAVGESGLVYGIDLSEEMLKIAQGRAQSEALSDRVRLTCADAVTLPYPSHEMDAIFVSFTLELFDTPEIPQVLGECKRVLRSGGRIVVVGMSKEDEEGMILRAFEWTHRHFPNLLDCRPIFVRQAVEAAGFRIETVQKRTMWVPVEIVLGVKEGRPSGCR
jgi:ubiquinone/menaquinone biosynthesis C-methylase UbiE